MNDAATLVVRGRYREEDHSSSDVQVPAYYALQCALPGAGQIEQSLTHFKVASSGVHIPVGCPLPTAPRQMLLRNLLLENHGQGS